jgi:hypothetical protein
MMMLSVIAILLSSSAPTPADLGNCVQSKAISLANEAQSISNLAEAAVDRCHEISDKLAAARDASAGPSEKDPRQRKANSLAWRQNLRGIMTQLATSTIEEARSSK